jgi:hypothetical protein
MARYKMEDDTVVNTESATTNWNEDRDWNGSNHIGRSSRSQWHDQTLYRSRKGRYYIEYRSRVQGQMDHAEWISPQAATRWLLLNEYDLPEELKQYEEQVTE